MRMVRFFTILSLLLMSLPGGTIASPGSKVHLGRLAGRVLGPNGAPVAGARVTVETSDGRHPHATSTDRQGRFSFPNILAGPYDARAYRGGSWSEWQHNVIVHAGKTTDITLRIFAKKPSTGFAAKH
jgi:protocatechuate 3,4-dioxygenase beta subunit